MRIPIHRLTGGRILWPGACGAVVLWLTGCANAPMQERESDYPVTAVRPPIADEPTEARAVDGRYISWREHIIDDPAISGVPISGSDGLTLADLDGDGGAEGGVHTTAVLVLLLALLVREAELPPFLLRELVQHRFAVGRCVLALELGVGRRRPTGPRVGLELHSPLQGLRWPLGEPCGCRRLLSEFQRLLIFDRTARI